MPGACCCCEGDYRGEDGHQVGTDRRIRGCRVQVKLRGKSVTQGPLENHPPKHPINAIICKLREVIGLRYAVFFILLLWQERLVESPRSKVLPLV